MIRIFNYTIDDVYNGVSIKTLLHSRYSMSTALISNLKKYDDGIMINGKRVNVLYKLNKGEVLTLTMHDGVSESITPTDIPLDIIYEDEDIMVINKPPHMPTHPSAGNYENTLANGVIACWKQRGETGVFRAVNRLDKNTSGVIVIAKNAYTHARMCDELRNNLMKKTYIAIVCGHTDESGTVNAPIGRYREGIIKRCVRSDGRTAITHYKTIMHIGDRYSLVKVRPETGRTHQIRVHMAHISHPLAGDFLYGVETHEASRQMLHAYEIGFIHPVTNEHMNFLCDIPHDMRHFIDKNS